MNWTSKFKKTFIKFFHLEPKPSKILFPVDHDNGLTYEMKIKISCTDVPSQENIPEEIVLTFKATDKEKALELVFLSLSKSWSTIKQECDKKASEQRMKNDVDKK